MAITSAANPTSVGNTGVTTLSVTSTAPGDVWLFYTEVHDTNITVTGVSGGNASNWTNITGDQFDGTGVTHQSIWIGTINSTGTTNINVSYSGNVASTFLVLAAQPFHSSLGSLEQWTVDNFGINFGATGSTINFPSFTGQASIPELYWGHVRKSGTISNPQPAGFVTNNEANGNPIIYGTATGAITPTLTQSPSGAYQAIGVLISEVGFTTPLLKQSTTQTGTSTTCTFTLANKPAVGDLMIAAVLVDTPTTVKSPIVYTSNIVDNWTPVFATQDTQQIPDTRGLRLHVFYKTANATDATQTQFTFSLPALQDLSQAGVPQYPTTDFAGILLTYQSSGAGFAGFDCGSPQQFAPNGNQSTFQLPSVNTHGGVDTFLSLIATLGQPTIGHTDPSAASVLSVSNTSPQYISQALTLALWDTTVMGNKYPFAFTSSAPSPYQDVITATLGLRTATNFYYNCPFLRMGYPYEGPDQMLILRYPYHWAFSVLVQGASLLIGQSFSQDQYAAATRYYSGKMLLNPSSDFSLILNAGIGGDFNPV